MALGCPTCSNQTRELLSCEVCQSIGCARCITKSSKQWVCTNCKSGNNNVVSSGQDNSIFSMFG